MGNPTRFPNASARTKKKSCRFSTERYRFLEHSTFLPHSPLSLPACMQHSRYALPSPQKRLWDEVFFFPSLQSYGATCPRSRASSSPPYPERDLHLACREVRWRTSFPETRKSTGVIYASPRTCDMLPACRMNKPTSLRSCAVVASLYWQRVIRLLCTNLNRTNYQSPQIGNRL